MVAAHVYTVTTFNSPYTARETCTWASQRCVTFPLYRSVAGRKDHRAWKIPQLDPAPCLDNFKVVLVGTKKAPSIGTVARALGAFECLSLCCAAPRVNITCRPSLNTSKGAQYLIHNAQVFDTLEEALKGSSYSVAFARWISGMSGCLLPCARYILLNFCSRH